ncbi:hypothetical protein [Galbibacter sp. BG1]
MARKQVRCYIRGGAVAVPRSDHGCAAVFPWLFRGWMGKFAG